MTLNCNCPACGAQLQLHGGVPYGVCRYCQSLLIRRDAKLEAIGRVAEVPDDLSPLQLGSNGYFDKTNFTLIGRARKSWDEGSWNEWCALFDDQRIGWLAEAQGDLVMTFEQAPNILSGAPTKDKTSSIQPGDSWRIGGGSFSVSDIKEVRSIAAEGELANFTPQNQAMVSVDLRGASLAFATVEFSADDIAVFVGRFVEFSECRFNNLRQMEGWGQAQ